MIFEKDSWQEIFATIRKNKLRTALTMLGVFWGIFMLVIMLGSGNGLRNGILKGFGGTATNSFFCWAQQTSKAYKGYKPGRRYNFNTSDVEALKKLPELDIVHPMIQLGGHDEANNVIRGLKTVACEILANYPNYSHINEIKLEKGRFVNDIDIEEKRKICVIGQRVAEVLFKKDENIIGEYIRINGVYFKIVGLTLSTGSGNEAREQAQRIFIPFTTFSNAFNYGDMVGWFAVKVKTGISAEDAEKKVISILKERHKVAPEDLKAIGHWNMSVEFNKLNGLFTGIRLLIWFVGAGTLLAGVIGISNIMLIVVKERTKEIGVKRALGAVPMQIIGQVLLESIFLTAISGYFGLISGIGLLELLDSAIGNSSDTFLNPTVDLSVALTALTILIISGAFAGLIPANKAVSIKPVEALRSE
ncbi:ABC transporter permease [Aurantibacillus circumpalustris]|uniref:ABC transporter permease n=1 Tax=Aurantibacillus circumpalustris TaxID=3036359 RepID=UPI00295AB0CC|nr:ABC transporter permease [Aurantibacillus circumpalustris]